MNQIIKAGISGFIIVMVITLFSPVNTYFFPYLFASIIVIYAFGLKAMKDGIFVAFIIYIFSEWILLSFSMTFLWISNETITLTVDASMFFAQILTPFVVLFAGLLGSELAERTRALPLSVPPPPSTLTTPSPPKQEAKGEEKKFCRYCGAENKTDADFCEKCGRKIG